MTKSDCALSARCTANEQAFDFVPEWLGWTIVALIFVGAIAWCVATYR